MINLNEAPQPWERLSSPPSIPDPCDAVVLRLVDDEEFALLIQANLVPAQDREGFRDLWVSLAFNDDLAERTFDLLDDWLDRAEIAIEDDPSAPRLVKFRERCNEAFNRLLRVRDLDTRPASVPASGTSAYSLAAGIVRHREAIGDAATAVDQALWAALPNARDRARRGGNSKDWASAPTFTSQLVAAVRSHRSRSTSVRAADEALWRVLT